MKKIYYLQKHEVKLGDVIEYAGIRTILTEELIELNPELFSIEEDSSMDLWAYIPSIEKEPFKLGTQPMYFKCVNSKSSFTLGRVYEQKDHSEYPERVSLKGDNGVVYYIKDWTSNFISKNYNCFELTTKAEWDKQELIDEAKRRYPIGTVYKHFNSEYTITSPDMLTVSEMDHHFEGNTSFGTSIWVMSGAYNGVVYTDGEWAEILPLKFTTEDGVSIYGDMKTYLVHPNDSGDIRSWHCSWYGGSKADGDKYFYHKENALAYIKKHKEKTLEDYENSLGLSVWNWFKPHELKLYYTKILQLIADDLNDGRYIHERGQVSFHINKEGGVNLHMGDDEGCVYFKSNELAQRAINILGDKLECLFNQA